AAVLVHLSLVDPEAGQPDRVVHAEPAQPTLLKLGLHLGERGIGRLALPAGWPLIGYDPEAAACPDGEERRHALGMPEDADLVRLQRAINMNVGQNPIVGLELPGEFDPKLFATGAVRSIAGHEPIAPHLFTAAVGVLDYGLHVV